MKSNAIRFNAGGQPARSGTTVNRKSRQFLMGIDFGTRQDYTTIAVLDMMTRIQRNDRLEGQLFSSRPRSLMVNYGLVKLERLPLNMTYPAIVEKIHNYLNHPSLYGKTLVACDANGPGLGPFQYMQNQGISTFGIMATGGENIGQNDIGWTVPKKTLVGYLRMVLDSDRLTISKKIEALNELLHEIQNFRRDINRRTNNETFENARDAIHDDLVNALMLAVFLGEHLLGGNRPLEASEPGIEENFDDLRAGVGRHE
jgi:hypothetical protein